MGCLSFFQVANEYGEEYEPSNDPCGASLGILAGIVVDPPTLMPNFHP